MPATENKPDTRDVHSALAFSILMEGPYRGMAERIGMTRIGYDGDEIVFQVGPKLAEIGRGLTVRQAIEAAWRHWNSKSE